MQPCRYRRLASSPSLLKIAGLRQRHSTLQQVVLGPAACLSNPINTKPITLYLVFTIQFLTPSTNFRLVTTHTQHRPSSHPPPRKMPPATATTASSSSLAHFLAIPWCAAHLRPPSTPPNQHPKTLEPLSRVPKPDTTEDNLFAVTLSSGTTISHFLLFHRAPAAAGERIDELSALLTLQDGLNGFPGVCHGGVVAAVLDEVVGQLTPLNRAALGGAGDIYMTVDLRTRFRRPVRTPCSVLVVARLLRVEGRKVFIAAEMTGEDGLVLASAEAVFVRIQDGARL